MFIIVKDHKVISTTSIKPCEEDLKSRNETCIEKDTIVSIGDIYSDGEFASSGEPIKEPEEVPLEELSNESLIHLIRTLYQDSYHY